MQNKSRRFSLLNFILLVGFALVYVFVRLKSFRKNNKLARSCPNNLKYYTTGIDLMADLFANVATPLPVDFLLRNL